jgi:hypothetical protein
MKSLVLAIILFLVVLYGCHDVAPFKAIKRVLKRTPSKRGTGRIQTAPLPPEPEYTSYPVRRRHY